MAKPTFPTRIQKMIRTGWEKKEKASVVTERINNSATAKSLGESYTTRQIAAAMAWHTMRARS